MRLLLGSTAVALLAASAFYGGFEQSDSSVTSRELQSAMCGGGQQEGVGVGGAAIPAKEISEWPIWPGVSGKVERAAMCGGCGQACGRVSGTSGSMAPGVTEQRKPPSAGCGCCGQRGTLVVLERLTDWLVGPTASEDRERSCACGTNMAMMSRMNAGDPNRKGDIPKQ